MTTKIALGLALTWAMLPGCERKPAPPPATGPSASGQAATGAAAPSEAQIKQMLSRAAGMPGNLFRKMIEQGHFSRPETYPNHYLTLDLLVLPGGLDPPSRAKAGMPRPSAVAAALVGGRKLTRWLWYASVIWPQYVKELKVARSGDQITGSAAFEAPGAYAGRVEFALTPIRGDPGWKVTRLAVPETKIDLRLADDGTWKPASKQP